MQEIIVRKFLQTSRRANIAVVYEPKVRGRSGATHKVEFVFYQPLEVVEISLEQTACVPSLPGRSFTS